MVVFHSNNEVFVAILVGMVGWSGTYIGYFVVGSGCNYMRCKHGAIKGAKRECRVKLKLIQLQIFLQKPLWAVTRQIVHIFSRKCAPI